MTDDDVRGRIAELVGEQRSAHDVPELAAMLSKSERQVRRIIADGELEYVKIGRARFVTDRALLDYLERQKVRAKPKPRKPKSSPGAATT